MAAVALLLILAGCLAAGLPIFLALGLVAVGGLWHEGIPFISVAQIVLDQLNTPALVTIPFFVIAATFIQRGGVAAALVDWARACVGRAPGGLALVSVAATMVFAAVCGSSVATALTMGTILVPAMVERRYDRSFALGVVGASGTLGILIPPSLTLIVFAIAAEESLPRVFLAGVVPGLLQGALFAAWVAIHARRRGYPLEVPPEPGMRLQLTLRAVPALLIPVTVLGGLYGGLVTVTEAAALAALLAIGISVWGYGDVAVREIGGLLAESVRTAAALVLIVASALLLAHWVTRAGISTRLVELVATQGLSAWQFLLVMNVVMLGLGTFLESISVILITVPLVLPLLVSLGIEPVH